MKLTVCLKYVIKTTGKEKLSPEKLLVKHAYKIFDWCKINHKQCKSHDELVSKIGLAYKIDYAYKVTKTSRIKKIYRFVIINFDTEVSNLDFLNRLLAKKVKRSKYTKIINYNLIEN